MELSPAQSKSQRVLFISDIHRGAGISNLESYEKSLLQKMHDYDHIVLNGDIFELFYIDPKRVDGAKKSDPKDILMKSIRHSIKWLEHIIKENPDCHLHFVLGNHEAVRKFRRQLDTLHEKYPNNFEWDPESIRLGDALITHGDLQMSRQTDSTRPTYRIRDAKAEQKWSRWMAILDAPGQTVVDYLRRPYAAVGMVHAQLKEWDGKNKFHTLEDGQRKPFVMDWVKHVFFGHTHVKFNNIIQDGIAYHNTGAFTHAKSSMPSSLGVLEATLEDGKIANVKSVQLTKGLGR